MRRAPKDGIVSIQRAGGWLARHWRASLQPMEMTHAPSLARGRTLARGGRVRDLWFSPGLVGAEVVDRQPVHVNLRFRVFEDEEWDQVRQVLLGSLSNIAALMEGDLPREPLSTLDQKGLRMLPSWRRTWGRGSSLIRDVTGDCDCDDAWRLPCRHMAAVYTVLGDALDGDPFLLLTLRGRSRPQLLAELRAAWGDLRPLVDQTSIHDREPTGEGWFSSPVPLPPPRFDFNNLPDDAAGLRALGPPPGGENDLARALEPLYQAGAQVAIEMVYSDPKSGGLAPTPAPATGKRALPGNRFTQKLVDLLDVLNKAKTTELAAKLGVPVAAVRSELIELEEAGLVSREGRTRGTRWSLG